MTGSGGRSGDRAHGNAGGSASSASDARWSPDPESVEDYPVEVWIDDDARLVGRQGLDRDNGRLSEFALVAQVRASGRWLDVARVDTCHEEVHLHLLARSGKEIKRTVLRPVCCQEDVDVGYEQAETMLLGEWDELARRWNRGK